MISDIEKDFLQVSLQHTDRDVTRFLWLKDVHSPATTANVQAYGFCRIPFGIISSPFLLAATVDYHLRASASAVAGSIREHVNVDNVFGGASTEDSAVGYYLEAKALFSEASMNLREWFSNSPAFLNRIDRNRGKSAVTPILGLKWNLANDDLQVKIGPIERGLKATKRIILQTIASVFDPCGFFAPVTITGKLLMQRLWKEKHHWDDELPSEIITSWQAFAEDFQRIPDVKIARQLGLSDLDPSSNFELHCCCDASTKAYSAVVYIRVVHEAAASIDLLFSKTRVAPINTLSVPRLELMAVVIGTRILKFVETQLHHPINAQFVWTDSTCVLSWIIRRPVATVFVQNRLRAIQASPSLKFRFVPSDQNPADMPSRGINMDAIISSSLWWHGLPWLLETEESWPKSSSTIKHYATGPDPVSTEQCIATLVIASMENPFDIIRFSNLPKLYRVTAYVFRIIRHAQRKTKSTSLVINAGEIATAKQFWDKRVQQENCAGFIHTKPDKASIHLNQQLGVFIDSNGLLPCRGRYLNAGNKLRFPKLSPKTNSFTDLIISECHAKLMHTGVRHTLAEVRQEYWVLHARNQVRRVFQRCRLCRYYSGGRFRTPNPPPLPSFRINRQKSFATTGIDYLGPLLVQSKGNESVHKVWICRFTCAVIRAVHLEAVEDLSTEQFLICFRTSNTYL